VPACQHGRKHLSVTAHSISRPRPPAHTDRALLIEWPGDTEGAAAGLMERVMEPGPQSFDWRMRGQRLEGLTSVRMDDRQSRAHVRATLLARDLMAAHAEQVVYLTCNEAFFVDLLSNPYHRSRVQRLGLAQADAVFTLLGLVLHPSALVRQV